MKTIIIWDSCGEEPIKFLVVDGDYTRLSGVYINMVEPEGVEQKDWRTLQDELDSLVGQNQKELQQEFPLDAVFSNIATTNNNKGIVVIVAGYIP